MEGRRGGVPLVATALKSEKDFTGGSGVMVGGKGLGICRRERCTTPPALSRGATVATPAGASVTDMVLTSVTSEELSPGALDDDAVDGGGELSL